MCTQRQFNFYLNIKVFGIFYPAGLTWEETCKFLFQGISNGYLHDSYKDIMSSNQEFTVKHRTYMLSLLSVKRYPL